LSILKITVELIIGFFVLFIIVNIIGRKIINQISPLTFIASIVLGEMLGNAMFEEKVGILLLIYSMSLWGALLFTVEYLSRKSLFIRGVFQGKPITLIKNGVVDREALKKSRMNINQLQSLLRQSETFSIREVAFCYLESSGSLSILKKSKYQKTTTADFKMPSIPVYVPTTVIRDGIVLWDELKDLGFDEAWLKGQLAFHNLSDYKDILIAEWLEGDGMFVQTNHLSN